MALPFMQLSRPYEAQGVRRKVKETYACDEHNATDPVQAESFGEAVEIMGCKKCRVLYTGFSVKALSVHKKDETKEKNKNGVEIDGQKIRR